MRKDIIIIQRDLFTLIPNQHGFLFSVKHIEDFLFFWPIQLKLMGSSVVVDPTDFHCMAKKHLNALQKILFCVTWGWVTDDNLIISVLNFPWNLHFGFDTDIN